MIDAEILRVASAEQRKHYHRLLTDIQNQSRFRRSPFKRGKISLTNFGETVDILDELAEVNTQAFGRHILNEKQMLTLCLATGMTKETALRFAKKYLTALQILRKPFRRAPESVETREYAFLMEAQRFMEDNKENIQLLEKILLNKDAMG